MMSNTIIKMRRHAVDIFNAGLEPVMPVLPGR